MNTAYYSGRQKSLKISIFVAVSIIIIFACQIEANRAYGDETREQQKLGLIPVYMLWNDKDKDHMATVDMKDLKLASAGWNYEGIIGYIFETKIPGTIPLVRYYNDQGELKDHYWTTDENFKKLAPRQGYHYEKILGYIYKDQQPDTIPLYQFFSKSLKDHFTTTDIHFFQYAKEFGNYDYICVEGYVVIKKGNKE